VPLALTGLAATVSWFTCLRPMRRGGACTMAGGREPEAPTAARTRGAELAELRAESEVLERHNPGRGAAEQLDGQK